MVYMSNLFVETAATRRRRGPRLACRAPWCGESRRTRAGRQPRMFEHLYVLHTPNLY